MYRQTDIRTYGRDDSIVFLKTNDQFGGLSNMARGFPLEINGIHIRTAEALYQACRFPHRPDVQRVIIEQGSPMTAKMKSKRYRDDSRPDWERVRIRIMRWCLRVKLAQNWGRFSELLLATGDRPIVEQSRRDEFWGAKPVDAEVLTGVNVLGRLLMELREELKGDERESLRIVPALQISDFLLYGQPIGTVVGRATALREQNARYDLHDTAMSPESHEPKQMALSNALDAKKRSIAPISDETARELVGAAISSYPKYKDSHLPWLGEIPAHWEIRRNGRLFAQRNETGYPELPILEVSLRTGVRVRDMSDTTRKQIMSVREQYKRAVQGDIAYNMMRMWQGAVGVAPVDGLISPAYVVARPYPETDSRYFSYLFRTAAYMDEVDKYSRGIVKDRNRLYWESFKQMPSVFPPPEEQRSIVAFLDAHGRLVTRFIRAKRRMIDLLNEQKRAIIQRAVTRGLDPHVPLKPSGVEWLGDVPEHWEIKKLKSIATSIVGGSTPRSDRAEYWNGDIVWITPEDVSKADVLIDSIRKITSEGLASCSSVLVPPGSIIITSRAPVGNVAVAETTLCTNQGCKAVVPRLDQMESDFAYFLLRTLKTELQSLAKGTTFTEISTFTFANVKAPVPPLLEQHEIVRSIRHETTIIDNTILRANQQIDLIREYRTRLIADVVTGKLDVRGVELPALDDDDTLDEWDEGDSGDDAQGETDTGDFEG